MDSLIHPPHFLNQRETYLEAIGELAKPYPAITLDAWPLWNKMTGGFRTREFTILCGATGAGKTTFLANKSAQLLIQGVKHFVMSVETGHTDYMKRIMSALVGHDLNTGDPVHVDDLSRIHAENAKFLESDTIEFSLYDNRVSVEQLMADISFMVERGCKLVFIDNLNFFLEVTRAADSIVEMDRVIHELIIFCKRVDVHLVMVMHPKKTENGRVESEFDIKGSSTAVQEAHNVFLLNRPAVDEIRNGRNPLERDLRIAKMRRRGAYVGRTIVFEAKGTRYDERWIK